MKYLLLRKWKKDRSSKLLCWLTHQCFQKHMGSLFQKVAANQMSDIDWKADRQMQHTHTLTHYYDRNGSQKVCQEYQTHVLEAGNCAAMIAVWASAGMTIRPTETRSLQTGNSKSIQCANSQISHYMRIEVLRFFQYRLRGRVKLNRNVCRRALFLHFCGHVNFMWHPNASLYWLWNTYQLQKERVLYRNGGVWYLKAKPLTSNLTTMMSTYV